MIGKNIICLNLTTRAGNFPFVDKFTIYFLAAVNHNQKLKLTTRHHRRDNTIVEVCGVRFGGSEVVVLAGPCAVEDEGAMDCIAGAVAACGARGLRGGAFKPRTSPYSFQGLGKEGLKLLRAAADAYSLIAVTEVLDVRDLDAVCQYADIVQIGARNMQNYALLRELGTCGKPVLLKRGMGATIEEWLSAAEYVMVGGNSDVILCERGVRGFDPQRPIIPDIAAIAMAKKISHLPVIFDPSHSTGSSGEVCAAAMAATAAGADGLLVEVHCDPERAASDVKQTISTDDFAKMMQKLRRIASCIDRSIEQA